MRNRAQLGEQPGLKSRDWGAPGNTAVRKREEQASQVVLVVKNSPANAGDVRDVGSIPGLGRSLEKGTATHSSILGWRIPWTEEPGGLQSIELQRVGHN